MNIEIARDNAAARAEELGFPLKSARIRRGEADSDPLVIEELGGGPSPWTQNGDPELVSDADEAGGAAAQTSLR